MLKAVVFDDEYIVLEGLNVMIDWAGFGIELAGTAGDGKSALNLVRELAPDLVLTDIRMPGMDGLELIEKIAEERPDTAFIVFSGFNEFEYVKRAIHLGVADYLEKPITIESIGKALGKVVRQLEKQREAYLIKEQWERSRREESGQAEQAEPKGSPVEQARAYIDRHGMRDLTLQEVADHVGLNAAYLSVLFKETMGESYIKYLTRIRMERAKTLLLKGMKVGDVSEKVGYHTYRHFSEIFKKYTGIPPGQYKESSRPEPDSAAMSAGESKRDER
jgi:YesN/AraC family two-component response regulator